MQNPELAHKKDVLTSLETNRTTGLTPKEATTRLEQIGPNELKSGQRASLLSHILKTLTEPLSIILLVAVVLSLVSASYYQWIVHDPSHASSAVYESIAILILIIINVWLAVYQARSAEKSLDTLKNMAEHHARVRRDSDWDVVPAATLVPGDIIAVRTGDFIEADLRWLSVSELQVNESHLTGESEPVDKQTHALTTEVPLGDRTNMGYSGSMVTHGSGLGVVTAIGMSSEMGNIADMLTNVVSKPTPIEQTINNLTKKLMLAAFGVVILTLGLEIFKAIQTSGGLTFTAIAESLSTAIALAVAAIPDALPAVLSIVLTIGATKLVKNQGLIKSLNSVETLGATSFIASDKTGTLTKNEMTVVNAYINGQGYTVEGNGYEPIGDLIPDGAQNDETADPEAVTPFLEAAILNNEAELNYDQENDKYLPSGNPTDIALVVLGRKMGLDREHFLSENGYEIVRLLPFDSDRKRMSVIVKCQNQYLLMTKGAPDVIFDRALEVIDHGVAQPMAHQREQLENVVATYGKNALRTLAIATRIITEKAAKTGSPDSLERDLTILGIAGIIDPPRPEVKQSIATLKKAHVTVVMITGDHPITARAIAKRLGIVDTEDAAVITGSMLNEMSDEALKQVAPETRVYARVSPTHKQRIIKALQEHDEIVAMTGDGINDAPALRVADIGIAMGINGTEVTKDAADLILMDDKFTTIEKTVQIGRTIFGNIRNFMRHELTTNIAEVLSLLLGVVFITGPIGHVAATTPTLTALMVLWVNMVSDALPSFALAYDRPESDLMAQPPRDPQISVLSGMQRRIWLRGIVMGSLVFLAFVWAAKAGMSVQESQTIAFLTLVFGQLWHVFDARSTRTLYHRNPFSNPQLLVAVAFAALASLAITLIPFFQTVMGTAALTWKLYLTIILVTALPTFILSGIKEFWLHTHGK